MSKERYARRMQLIGWALFLLSALGFMFASARAGDWVSFAASGLFFLACIFFLLPYW